MLPWFAAVGSLLDPSEQNDAAAYLQGLGIADARMETVPDWQSASDIVKRTDFSPDWWSGEDRLASNLTDTAIAALGRETVDARLSGIGTAASGPLQGAASTALARFGIADAGLGKSAAGSASVAVHHAALALAAGCSGEHPFAAKFRLFQAGHWPLGVYGGVFHIL